MPFCDPLAQYKAFSESSGNSKKKTNKSSISLAIFSENKGKFLHRIKKYVYKFKSKSPHSRLNAKIKRLEFDAYGITEIHRNILDLSNKKKKNPFNKLGIFAIPVI